MTPSKDQTVADRTQHGPVLFRLSARDWAAALGILLAVVLVFGRAARNGFVLYDDVQYVTENPLVVQGLTWHGTVAAFAHAHAHAGNWFPLTWLSHMLDWQVFGPNAAGHHAVSVVLHGANAAVLFLVLAGATGARGPAAAAALLFALHPMRVESVAWVSSRKDVLSGLFFVLTLAAYMRYASRRSPARYCAVALALACGLMAKQTLMTTPFVLLLLDVWPLRRAHMGPRALVVEKVPLFVLAGAGAFAAFAAQRAAQAGPSFEELPFVYRAANAAMAYGMYLFKTAVPVALSPIYPHAGPQFFVVPTALGAAALVAVTAIVWSLRNRVPAAPIGWFWFVGMVAPVSGLVQVGSQSYADRFTYLPHIGLFVGICWTATAIANGGVARRRALSAACALVVAAFSACAWRQTTVWRDSVTLFEHAVRIAPYNGIAIANLGRAYLEAGRLPEAEAQFRTVLAHSPENAEALGNLAVALLMTNRATEAEVYLRQAAALAPADAEVLLNWAVALATLGRNEEAERKAKDALALAPDFAKARQFLEVFEKAR